MSVIQMVAWCRKSHLGLNPISEHYVGAISILSELSLYAYKGGNTAGKAIKVKNKMLLPHCVIFVFFYIKFSI